MSLTINTAMTTKDGGTVASGAFIQFETNFPAGELIYNISMNVWRSETDKNNGKQELRGIIEVPQLSFRSNLTVEDFNSLTPVAVHNKVKEYLEGFLGVDTVTINS